MKKLLMMLWVALLASAVYGQVPGSNEWRRQMRSLRCAGNETLEQCKIRVAREEIEKQRYEDSVKRERDSEKNRRNREEWTKEKERRDRLTPEEREKEDAEKAKQSYNDKKKIEDMVEVIAGINYADKSGTDPSYTPVIGILLGVHIRIMNISDEISLGGGAAYSMQGGKYESSEYIPGGNYGSTTNTSRLNYLNFPVLVRYQKNRNGFFAEAGLQPGLLLSAKNKGATTTDIKEDVNKFDIGVPIGVGYKLKNKFAVGLRLTPGLMNVNKDEQYKNRNIVASLRVSYSF